MSHGYILVVDDEFDHRELIGSVLEEMGFEVGLAENGRVALDKLEERLPDLVLLDLRMPVMSGWAVLEALKQMPRARSIPVLVISGYGYEWEAELIGAAGYISKPIDVDVLRHKVEALLGEKNEQVLH